MLRLHRQAHLALFSLPSNPPCNFMQIFHLRSQVVIIQQYARPDCSIMSFYPTCCPSLRPGSIVTPDSSGVGLPLVFATPLINEDQNFWIASPCPHLIRSGYIPPFSPVSKSRHSPSQDPSNHGIFCTGVELDRSRSTPSTPISSTEVLPVVPCPIDTIGCCRGAISSP